MTRRFRRLRFEGVLSSYLPLILLAATFCGLMSVVLWGGIATIIGVTPDDASYFLKIAQNGASGNGLSFDGIHKTNGEYEIVHQVCSLTKLYTRPCILK